MAEERTAAGGAARCPRFPADITFMDKVEDIKKEMMLFNRAGNDFVIPASRSNSAGEFLLRLTGPKAAA